MKTLHTAPGETAHYTYDARSDTLHVVLEDCPAAGDAAPLPDQPGVWARRDPASGRPVALEVRGVQQHLLERLARELVTAAREAPPVVPAPTPVPDTDTRPAPTAPTAADDGAAPAGSKRKRRRRKRSAESAPADASPVGADDALPPITADGPPTAEADASAAVPEESAPAAAEGALPWDTGPLVPEVAAPADPVPAPMEAEAPAASVESRPAARDAAPATPAATAGGRRAPEPVPPGAATPEGFAFCALDARLGAAIQAMGFQEPTPIQRRAVPPAMEGRDVKGLAQTGTGKTLAYLLPALQRLLERPAADARPRLLVVTPTRELAAQVGEHAEALARFTPLRVSVVYGGESMGDQIKSLRRGTDVVVATPGRLLDHVNRRNVQLDAIRVVVLDETDRMLDMGFMPDVRRIFDLLPVERQTLLFGATLPPDIESLSARFQTAPELVEVARQLPPATLEQRLYPVGRHLKIPLLIHLLRTEPGLTKVLVFAETKVETDVVTRKLGEAGLRVAAMHGDRPQKDRERALSRLKEGDLQALVATNVAARGLDIEELSHVVNYDMPQTVDDYVHRIGRTARGAVAEGTAYTFVAPGDETMVQRIEAVLDRSVPRFTVPDFDYDVPTPSWARTSAKDLARSLTKPGKARFSRSFVPRRR